MLSFIIGFGTGILLCATVVLGLYLCERPKVSYNGSGPITDSLRREAATIKARCKRAR
jgi:hypothetical protein